MERLVTTSQVWKSEDGDVALLLDINDGSSVLWIMDAGVIAAVRRQLDRAEQALQSPTRPAK
jgi:hypothetical protein